MKKIIIVVSVVIVAIIVFALAVMNALTPVGIFRASFWGF